MMKMMCDYVLILLLCRCRFVLLECDQKENVREMSGQECAQIVIEVVTSQFKAGRLLVMEGFSVCHQLQTVVVLWRRSSSVSRACGKPKPKGKKEKKNSFNSEDSKWRKLFNLSIRNQFLGIQRMAFNKEPFVKHLVVDAVGFLKPASLEKIGENVYTTRDVVEEIRDQGTKQRLQVLPYQLNFVEPTPDNLKHVTEFSKKTGDFASLSATDLRLMAVVYQLEKEHGDPSRLRNEPVITKTYSTSKKLLDNPKDVVGFFLPHKDKAVEGEGSADTDLPSKVDSLRLSSSEPPVCDDSETKRTSANDDGANQETTGREDSGNDHESDDGSEEETEDVSEGDDDGGWITPANVQSAISKARDEGSQPGTGGQSIPVACLSTDFAVQNVLLHMGLHLTSFDGMLIKRLRTYVLRCFGCFKTTSIMTKKFCPECGNSTLKKVAVTVNPETGLLEYHLSKRKRISTRGTKYSVPMFKGGKHVRNPVLTADQPTPENRLSKKAQQRLDVLDPDYLARDSPFLMNDVTSRSAVLGVRSLHKVEGRRNPNDWSQRGGKKR